MLHQNVLSQIKRIQLPCFLPLNLISLVVLSLILFFTNINIYAAQVSLAWGTNSESDLAGYKVYYGNSSGSYDSNIDVGNQTSYTIQNLVEGQMYYIAVTAYDTSNNESGYSAEVVYNVPDTTLPSIPTTLQATVVSTSQIDLAWNASTDNVGVTGYRIYRDGIQVADISSITFQDTGLSPSTTYSYTVSAYDAAGNESGQSSMSSATTLSLPVNNPPVLSTVGNKSVNEGQALSFTISATDSDGDTLSYTTNNLPSGASFNENTKTFAWTPTYSQAGIYSNITFQVSDGIDIDSESITITVGDINRPPVLDPISDIMVNEGAAITLSPTATDLDGDALTYTYSGWMTSASYTTNYTDAGTHTVTVTVSDGTLSDSQDVIVTVNNVNQAPVLDPISDITVNEGAAITLSPTATDPDGDALTYTYSGWMTSASYTTNYTDAGTHTVTVTVSDGTLSDSQDVTVTVGDINRPPVLDSISDITVSEGVTITFNPTATDPDGDTLTFSYTGWMTSASYTTNNDDAGTHTVTVTVSDGSLSDSQDVIITVIDVDIISPSTPTSLQAVVVSTSQVDLSWNASTDNVGVTGYRIYRDGIQVADVSSTTYQDTGLSQLTTYVYTVSAYDDAGNESSQSTPVSATTQEAVTIFSNLDSYLGNTSNWVPLTPSRWDVFSDNGDYRYRINTTNYSNQPGNLLGEYSLIANRTYGDFIFTGKVSATEDLVNGSESADFDIVFGFQDPNNYYFMMFSSNSPWSALHKVVNGTRITIANPTDLSINDNSYHDVKLEKVGNSIKVYYDGVLKINTTDSTFLAGQVGIGSYDDAPLWDDIVVTIIDTVPPAAPQGFVIISQ